jgi:hypothetical protein
MDGTSTTQPGWYPDPQQANTMRYWDGAAWTADVRPMPLPATSGPVRPSGRRKWIWIPLVVILLLVVCGCPVASFVGLARIGMSALAKTQKLVESAPSDGSSLVSTLTVSSSTTVASKMSVMLTPPNDPADFYNVRLQPTYVYQVNGETVSMNDFYAATKRTGPKACALTYARSGIQSLNLIQ